MTKLFLASGLTLVETTFQSSIMDNSGHIDNKSEVSSLEWGSILPNSDHEPTRDTRTIAFVPPMEIFVEIKADVPDWLRSGTYELSDRPVLDRAVSAPSDRSVNKLDLRRQISWDSRCLDSRDIVKTISGSLAEPRIGQKDPRPGHDLPRCTNSTTSAGTLHTSPTDLSGDGAESLGLEVVPERRRMDTKFFVGRLLNFHRARRNLDLRRSGGCFA